ncbi:MAG: hypothetical protein JWQ69_2481, partial [Pseudomonas sp.]|nr:hypothetical protein [Pseudomonas sp.]
FTKHHNDQELQADSCAVKILSHVYDRQSLAASITAFEKDLPKMEPSTPTTAAKNDAQALTASMHDIVTSPMMRHPNTLERKQNLDAIYREVTAAGP